MMGNWTQVGTNMDPISMCNAKSHVLKNLIFSLTKTILLNLLEVKVKNRSKNELNIGRSLGIDFRSIFAVFGT